MTRTTIAAGVFAPSVLVLLGLAVGHGALEQDVHPAASTSAAITPSAAPPAGETHHAAEIHRGFLYGRITTVGGDTYEGRLRWGGYQEAFWGDYFNGSKDENPWGAHVPLERLPKERRSLEIFGFEIAHRERHIDLGRKFMARFGDIARIEARGLRGVRVTLKSGTVFDLDRWDASDFDDGVRVWDGRRGVVDVKSLQILTIDLLPTPPLVGAVPDRLHGTVRTRQGDFTGFVQWDREECVGSDELDGNTADGKLSLRFDTIRSIARHSPDSSLVTLVDGREIALSDINDVGRGNRGMYVDDRRYGRVRIPWDAFERVDFSLGGSGPAHGDFPPGHPLTGSVTTRDGGRLTGRLVYDLDESETTETLDAPAQGVDYTILFGLIASIVLPGPEERDAQGARVTLHSGEELQLEPTGDLGERNAGLLIFVDGDQRAEYLPWTDVERINFDRPPEMYPPLVSAGPRTDPGPRNRVSDTESRSRTTASGGRDPRPLSLPGRSRAGSATGGSR